MDKDGYPGTGSFRKAAVALKNIFSNRLQRRVLGFDVRGKVCEIPHGSSVAYAAACNDSTPAYFDKQGGLVPPLFAARMVKEVLEEVILHPGLGMNVLRMVHAEQSLKFHRPLRVGMRVTPRAVIDKIREVSTGEILDVEVSLSDEEGVVVEGLASMFMRVGGRGRRKRAEGERKSGGDDRPAMTEVARFSVGVDQPERYAAASGDYNPLHTSPFVARLAGFKGPIAHGLCVLAMTTGKLTEHLAEGDPSRLARVAVRFAHPVYPGQPLVVKVRQDALLTHFLVENDKGRPVLTEGQVVFK
jgi:acyl dehydratase